MEFRPHKYQDYAREFIIGHPVCALILDMGLGKTVITLSLIHICNRTGACGPTGISGKSAVSPSGLSDEYAET